MNSRRIAILFLGAALAACTSERDGGLSSVSRATGIRFLSGQTAPGFARASATIPIEFPRDHGAHPRFQTEWWYFTGNLFDANRRHFGFESTFFRYALSATTESRASRWGTNQIWMSHLAVTDTSNQNFMAEEAISREALGIAGASTDGLDVWVKGWSARSDERGRIRIEARGNEIGIDLVLDLTKRIVLHGDRGLDRKGPESGNASYYYSAPRLEVTGSVFLEGQSPIGVTGSAWLDREWGTSSLSPGVEGWDWFALQLSDDTEIMYYRLRNTDGGTSAFSGGTLVMADGTTRRLHPPDVEIFATEYWTSSASGVRYPTHWRMLIPNHSIDIDIQPTLKDQELDLSVRYWEGAITISGSAGNGTVSGIGYLELAGYGSRE